MTTPAAAEEAAPATTMPVHPSVPTEEIHRELGHYGITGTLAGRGKFAKVYIAYDLRTGDKVAARISSIAEEDIDAEHRVLRKINNTFAKPYVVKVYDKFTSSKYFVMFMEYCEGGDLETLIKNQAPLPFDVCRRFFAQIGTALRCMHAVQVMHRDLKPANIMLTSRDLKTAELRLIDFGFAKRANIMQSMKGTPAYMAPERLNRESYGFSSEVYAAGLILFEMVYAYQPFATAKSLMDLYSQQESLKVPETRGANAERVPDELRSLLAQCLSLNGSQRPTIEALQSNPWLTAWFRANEEAPREVTPEHSPAVQPLTAATTHSDPLSPHHANTNKSLRSGDPGTPMVRRAAAPPAPPQPSHMVPLAVVENTDEQVTAALTAGGMAIATVVGEGHGLPPEERIAMAAYAVKLVDTVAAKLTAAQASVSLDATGGIATSTSFSKSITLRGITPFATSCRSAEKIIREKCKTAVRDALSELKDTNVVAPPAVLLLLAYARRALLTAGRQEYLGESYCVFGSVIEVYEQCDAILRALELDETLVASGATRAISRMRERLGDRLIGAQSTLGVHLGSSEPFMRPG